MQFQNRFVGFFKFSCLIIIGIVLIALAFRPTASQASEDFSYNIRVNYDVQDSGNTHVTETYAITNNTTNRYLQSIQLSTPTNETNNLSVRYSDGAPIPAAAEKQKSDEHGYSYEFEKINISFPRQSVGKGTSWSFTVSYDTTKLVETKGQSHIVYIPAISAENSDSYSINLTVPKDFGPVHGVGAPAPSQAKGVSNRQYGINSKDLVEHSVALLFGDSATYQANFNFPLDNSVSSLAKTFTVTLPPNMPSQSVYINKLDPKPDSTSIDIDGNVLATYQVPAQTKLTVKTDILANVRYIEYDLGKSGTKAQIPPDLVARYTGPSKYWQSTNPAILAKAKQLTANKKTVAEQVQAINQYVIDTLKYNSDKIKYNIRQGSVQALTNPTNAVCLEYSDLSIALLRAAGIPARMPIGYGYSGNLKPSNSVSDSLHSWVETYVPNIGWMNVDPTWGEKFNNFGRSDLDHFAFAMWGTHDGEPAAVEDNGHDTNYQYENTTIGYTTFEPKIANDARIEATKWVILPFISVVSFSGKAPSNVASNDMTVVAQSTGGSVSRPVGQVAPAQSFSGLLGDFGSDFVQPSQTKLVRGGVETLSQTTTHNNFVIILVSTGLLIVLAGYKVVQLLSKQAKKKRPKEPQLHQDDEQPKVKR